MKLTRAGEYAIRSVLYLAGKKDRPVVGRREIARAMDIPHAFLGKVVQALDRAGLMVLVQGAKGGCRLARPPAEISMLDVVEAVEGPLFLNECLARPESCGRSSICAVHEVWGEARDGFRQTLREANFEDLARRDLALGRGTISGNGRGAGTTSKGLANEG
ncbi:MAG: Rrf2 family transcriptional regulator [Proteobacteria bacterium]|nr:Rrf2 family transcriptional regulator [Pseudomonadota bacterium]